MSPANRLRRCSPSITPSTAYRGCSHACRYCFARPTHEYLDLDSGTDFDSQVVVKTNVADVLRRELSRRSWQRETVALGTNTDPYQRAEGRYALMPGIIAALTDSGTPFSILTKGTLLRRDLPLITEAADTCRCRCGGVAGRRRSRTAQGRRAGHADTPGPTRAHLRHPRGRPGLSRHGRPGTTASDGLSGTPRCVVGADRRGGSDWSDGVRAAPEGFDARVVHGMACAVPSRTGVGVPRVVPARSVSAVGLQEGVARQGDSVDRQARPGSGSPVVSGCRDPGGLACARYCSRRCSDLETASEIAKSRRRSSRSARSLLARESFSPCCA